MRFAVENPVHFRVLNLPSIAAREPLQGGVAEWMQEELARLQAAQAKGALVDAPLEDILLATRALPYDLSRLIVDAQDGLGGIDAERAAQLAERVTHLLGVGLLPREAPRRP